MHHHRPTSRGGRYGSYYDSYGSRGLLTVVVEPFLAKDAVDAILKHFEGIKPPVSLTVYLISPSVAI